MKIPVGTPEEGVSEVVGTILILAITVILFATVFVYVQHIPPPQRAAQMVIQASVTNDNGYTYVVLRDQAGSTFNSNSTYLAIVYQNMVRSIGIYSLTGTPVFGPGDSVSLNLSQYGVQAQNLSQLNMFIFSSQYNQILWRFQGFSLAGIYFLQALATPLPVNPNSTVIIYASVYSPYNNTTVTVNLTKFMGKGYVFNMSQVSVSGDFRYFSVTVSTPSSINLSAEYGTLKAVSGRLYSTYNLTLYSSNVESPDVFIEPGGLMLQDPRPLHGSSDSINVLIRDNSPVAATFNLFIYDRYPNGSAYPIQNTLGLMKVGKVYAIQGNFSVGAYSTISIYLIWENVGGNGPGAGSNLLIGGLTNIRGVNHVSQYPNPANVTEPVYIEPKILLVNGQGTYSGTSYDVSEYYKVMLQYSGYTVDYISVPNNGLVSLSGYDLVIWFTGYNMQGISSQQMQELSSAYQSGMKVFIISAASSTYGSASDENFSGNREINMTAQGQQILNASRITTYLLGNFSYMNPDIVVENPNGLTVGGFSGEYINLITANYQQITYPISSAVYNSAGGKAVFMGFEFARLPLYQQDYLGNKILMWLFNVSLFSGYQLALTDIVPSTYSPLFSQPVNISFYITNLSPVNLNTTLEVLMNGNFYNYYTVNNIPKDGGFVVFNITWNASPPGKTFIVGIVDPFHEIPQINYALDVASSLVNTTIDVKYSVLILKLVKGTGHTQGSAFLNQTLTSLGVKYNWLYYDPSGNVNYSSVFKRYNTVIVDSDNSISTVVTGNYLSPLDYAIKVYYGLGTTSYSGLYSVFFIGNGTYYVFNHNSPLEDLLGIYFNGTASIRELVGGTSPIYEALGNNLTSTDYDFFGNYMFNSMGFLLGPSGQGSSNVFYSLQKNGLRPVLGTSWNGYGYILGEIGNLNGFRFYVSDFGVSQIEGIIQYHSSQYSPSSPALDARMSYMLMLMGFVNYTVQSTIPYVLSSSISYSSNILMIDRYYVITSTVLNLGDRGSSAVIDAYDGSGLFGTQTVYLPPLSQVPVQFIWDPQFAAMPQSPRDVRIVVSYIPDAYIQELNFMREGINQTPVYVFYDNLSTGANWNSYATVWAYSGVNFYQSGSSALYSVEPYNTEGYVAESVQKIKTGMYQATGPSLLFRNSTKNNGIESNDYWGFIAGGISGGFSLGTSYNYVYYSPNGYWTSGFYPLQTQNLAIHGSQYVYLQMDAQYELSNGGEGVEVFISPHGSSDWYLAIPMQGYPGNVNASVFGKNTNYYMGNKPIDQVNNAQLAPAFTMVSGGDNLQWVQYTFNLSQIIPFGTSSISIQFVLVINGNYSLNTYGNDYFYADNIKVFQNGTTGLGNTLSSMWYRERVGNMYFFNSSTIVNKEVASVISVPISFANLYNATLDFQTQYSIYAWFGNAADPRDTPYGFRLYVGTLGADGQVIWSQLDTRWAGEAGKFIGFQDASTIPSAYYLGEYAFHETGTSISLTGFIGLTIYLKFEVNGDYYNYSGHSSFNGSTNLYEPKIGSPYWADFTDVIITGQSYADLISVNEFWYS